MKSRILFALAALLLCAWDARAEDTAPAAAEAAEPAAPAAEAPAAEAPAAPEAPAPEKPAAEAPAPPPTGPKDPPRATLPVFEAGPWKDCYAVYEHADFTATMDQHGLLHIQLRNGKEPAGEPIVLNPLGVSYVIPGVRPRHYGRYPIEYDNPGTPVMQPRKIALKGKLRHDVVFTVTIEFQNNTILACAGFKDPPRLDYPSGGRMAVSFPASHKIPNHVEQPERERILQGCVLTTRERVGGKAKRYEYPYAKRFGFSGGFLEEAVARGPWGPRAVKVDQRNMRKQHMAGWNYTDLCPWEGFHVYVSVPEGDLSPSYRLLLTVD